MASAYYRVVQKQVLTSNLTSPRAEVIDLGAYKILEIEKHVAVAASAGDIILEHAAVNEPEYFVTLATLSLTGAGSVHSSVSNFLRFLRWRTNGITGSPSATVDIIAKD